MEVKTTRQINDLLIKQEKVFYTKITVKKSFFSEKNEVFCYDEVKEGKLRQNGFYILVGNLYFMEYSIMSDTYSLVNNEIHVFTTREDAQNYIDNFKLINYDKIRKKLISLKMDYLKKIEIINSKFKYLK